MTLEVGVRRRLSVAALPGRAEERDGRDAQGGGDARRARVRADGEVCLGEGGGELANGAARQHRPARPFGDASGLPLFGADGHDDARAAPFAESAAQGCPGLLRPALHLHARVGEEEDQGAFDAGEPRADGGLFFGREAEHGRGYGGFGDQAVREQEADEALADAFVGWRRAPQVRRDARDAGAQDEAVHAFVGGVGDDEVPASARELSLDRLPGAAGCGVDDLVDQPVLFEELATGGECEDREARFRVRAGEGLDRAQRDQNVPEPSQKLDEEYPTDPSVESVTWHREPPSSPVVSTVRERSGTGRGGSPA